MVYFVMALALFADDDYEEVAARLAGALGSWGCWDEGWECRRRAAITQARQRLGPEPLAEVFSPGGGAGRGPGHGRGVPGAVAADVDGRDGVGCPGHAENRGRVRVPRR